jgi:MFS family permease
MKPIARIYLIFLVFYLAVSLGRGFFPIWFRQSGLELWQIAAYYLIKLALPPIILLFNQNFSTRRSLALAFISEILLMMAVFKLFHPYQAFLAALFSGTTVVYFYLIYNTLFFENTPRDKRATSSGLYSFAGPFLGIIVPLIAGMMSQRFGLPSLFIAATGLIAICFLMIGSLPQVSFESNLSVILKKNHSLVIPLIIEGIKEAVPLLAIPVSTLLYIKEPLPYGIYLSYLAIVAVITGLLLGFISDRIKSRTIFLYPSTILTTVAIVFLGLTHDLPSWSIASGAFSFTAAIGAIFVTTAVLDKASSVKEGMIAREFLLGVGRIIGSTICLLFLLTDQPPQRAIIALGLIYLLFPLSVFWQKLYYLPVNKKALIKPSPR